MPLSTEAIPNKRLNGQELGKVIENAVHDMIAKDCMFNATLAYGRCAFTVTLAVHVGDFVDPKIQVRTYARREGAIEGDVPLKNPPEDAEFNAIERRQKITNPNLTRIHNDLPMRTQRRTPPEPGSPFGGVENIETRVAPGGYPPVDPPEDKDVTAREAAKLGVKAAQRQAYLDHVMPKTDEEAAGA